MADRLHSAFTIADGIHTALAWDVLDLSELGELAPEDIGKIARVANNRYYVLNGVGDGNQWRQFAFLDDLPAPGGGEGGVVPRRVQQALLAHVDGQARLQVGIFRFTAGEALRAGSRAFIGNKGTTGAVVLELIEEATSAVVASWSTTDALGDAVLLSDVVMLADGLYGLHIHGEFVGTRAIIRGLDWLVSV